MKVTNIHHYCCKACKQAIVINRNVEDVICPKCGLHQMVAIQGIFEEPDGIVPFLINKDTAKTMMRTHLKKYSFLPNVFTATLTIDTLQGVYIPFWLYDFKLKGTLLYDATKSFYSNDEIGRYQEVDYYEVIREGDMVFNTSSKVASSMLDVSLIESCKPFDFKKAVSFDESLFDQHQVIPYDADFMASKNQIEEQLKKQVMIHLEHTVSGYQTRSVKIKHTKLSDLDVTYLLFPFWIMNVSYKHSVYTYLINGQNGTIVGTYPMDKKKYWKLFLLYFIVIFIIGLCVRYVL